jgi:hypothetical protein
VGRAAGIPFALLKRSTAAEMVARSAKQTCREKCTPEIA